MSGEDNPEREDGPRQSRGLSRKRRQLRTATRSLPLPLSSSLMTSYPSLTWQPLHRKEAHLRRMRSFSLLLVGLVAAVALVAFAETRRTERRQPPPLGLTATIRGGHVALSWSQRTDGSRVAGYEIWRSEGPGSNWSLIARTDSHGYTDAAVKAGKAYGYAVRAYDGAGHAKSASAVVAVTLPALNANAGGSVVWSADAERPLDQEWAEYSTATHCAVTSNEVASDPQAFRESAVVAQGSYAYEFVADRGDAGKCYGGERTEIGQGLPERIYFSESRRFNQGDNRWISFQIRLGSDFPVRNPNWDLVAQWKQIASTTVVPGPMLFLEVYSGFFWLGAAGGTAVRSFDDEKAWRLARATTGRWIRMSIHIRFDTNPKIGFVEVYGSPNGSGMRKLLSRRQVSTLATDANGNWVPSQARIGIYRNAVIPGTAHLYYDGYTVATTRSAAEANAFRPRSG